MAEASSDSNGGRWQRALGGSLLLSNVECLPGDLAFQAVELLTDYLLSDERPHGLRLLLTSTGARPIAWAHISTIAFDIVLPPLRERFDDLPLLLRRFAPKADWDRQVLSLLSTYDWPGNITKLQRVTQQAALLACGKQIALIHPPSHSCHVMPVAFSW